MNKRAIFNINIYNYSFYKKLFEYSTLVLICCMTLFCRDVLSGLKAQKQIPVKENNIQVKLGHNKARNKKLKILIGILPNINLKQITDKDSDSQSIKDTATVADTLKRCIEYTEQFDVKIKKFSKIIAKADLKKLLDEGYVWIVFLNSSSDGSTGKLFEWRMYDPIDSRMVAGKKALLYNGSHGHKKTALSIADQLWYALMHKKSCFKSKIAYIKRSKTDLLKPCSVIYTADFDGSNREVFLDNGGVYAGIYWGQSVKNPVLLCSEFTRYNVRLVSFNLNTHNKSVIFNVDGTCIGISLADNTKQAVYCRSGDIWHYGYNAKYRKAIHSRVIKNDGKNTNPILLSNGDIIFCSSSVKLSRQKNKVPKIYYYDQKTKEIEPITISGYTVSPCYSKEKNQVIYSKKVNNFFQLFSYDLKSKEHKQLTFDGGNKVDASCSPCGEYIVFCYQQGTAGRIAIMDLNTKKRWFITPVGEDCGYPTWSKNLEA